METVEDTSHQDLLLISMAENGKTDDESPSNDDLSKSKKSRPEKTQRHSKISEELDIADIDEEIVCKICYGTFTYRDFRNHKKTGRHRLAKKLKENKNKPQSQLSYVEEPKFVREKYYIRQGVRLMEQIQQYHNILTTVLALRFSLNNDNRFLTFSMNNAAWEEFGDIVIEIKDAKKTKTFAIQCKKVLSKCDIQVGTLSEETGKLSIKQQCQTLSELRNRKDYDTTYFKLFTVANLIIDGSLEIIYKDVVDEWKNRSSKELWKDTEAQISISKKKSLINTTDDSDNICKVELINHKDAIVNQDLSKFNLYINQKKANSLKHSIRTMIQDKFGTKNDISNDIIKYVSEYFQTTKIHKYNYKMTKRDILLKTAELLLEPLILFPEDKTYPRSIKIWDDTIQKFDVIIMENDSDIVNKIYSTLNYLLQAKISSNLDTSIKSLRIDKNDVRDEAIKTQIFQGSFSNSQEVSLACLYITLWKMEQAPIVLRVENERNLQLINKVITFLKTEDISTKFILMTDFEVSENYFPDYVHTFTSLEDLKTIDKNFLDALLNRIELPILDSTVTLKSIVHFNMDFLEKVTPDALLNMALKEFSFTDAVVPMTDDIIDNTLVFNDAMIEKFKEHIRKSGVLLECDCLSYVVNVKGTLRQVEIPPNI